jgi:hypothetical protein
MTACRQVLDLKIRNEDLLQLTMIARSRTEPAGRVERAQMLLAYREDPSFFAVGRTLGVSSSDRPALHRAGRCRWSAGSTR